jgi:hypothetical protein
MFWGVVVMMFAEIPHWCPNLWNVANAWVAYVVGSKGMYKYEMHRMVEGGRELST